MTKLRLQYKVFFLMLICQYSVAQPLNFASIEKLIEQDIGRSIVPVFYQKLGIDILITPLPAERAQREAVSGVKDGEIMRIWSYGVENPDMLRVPTPYYFVETSAFIERDSNIIILDKSDLATYRVARVRGVKHTNNITQGLSQVFDMSDTEQMMKYLSSGMVDVVLTSAMDGQNVIERLGYENIKQIEPPLRTLKLYHYLNNKHKNLLPKIDAVIRNMKDSGELEALISSAKSQVLNQLH
ncbi:transporter substrate-binding domain-containing protein [Aliiglaciecola sp. LCG003]|uniref:substrate-binding periplasmic protein n=1 Tax=Aliiglaciecola sp. LCG003 TaxID=3053655 RepID=UPI002572C997|nr:transporter substrate-binding domain-containing protein [Aliiglaciecola sp. LCG003]WJG10873.1 transporter substrate-binding domain-containing protein [Aliiglaciecola sp. LCG003]